MAGPLLWLALLPTLLGAGNPADAAVGGAIGLLGLLFGSTLLARAISGGSGDRPRFGRRGALWPLLLFPLVLLAGALMQIVGGAALALLPVAHFFAALLPALAVAGLVARGSGGARLATVLAGLTWGGLGATTIALVLEGIFLLLIALIVVVGLQLDGGAALESAGEALATLSTAESPESMVMALKTVIGLPGVVVAGFGIFALLGPAVEELAKLGGVVLAAPSSRQEALLRGVAVGAGFGLVETVLLGGSAIGMPASAAGGGPQTAAIAQVGWPALMALRAVTTAMHAACSGAAALGWYAMSEQGRWSAGAFRIGLAILAHGLWNGLILTVLWSSIRLLGPDAQPVPDASPFMTALPVIATAALIALAWSLILGLRTMARRAADRSAAPTVALPR